MKLGVSIRVMGPQSTRGILAACARAADEAGLADLWVADHIAIPPDDAEGSGGRYLDPLASLAYLAGITRRIGLGTGVLILPYRPPLATAKWVATIQELSAGRLRLGVGVGWMTPEFRAIGVDRRARGRITDETLEFLHRCFESDEMEARGQRFLFLPRPARPPILVGGAPPHALERTIRFGDAWMPMVRDPEKLVPAIEQLREIAAREGRDVPGVTALGGLSLRDPGRAIDEVRRYEEIGVDHFVVGFRYADADDYRREIDILASKVLPAIG